MEISVEEKLIFERNFDEKFKNKILGRLLACWHQNFENRGLKTLIKNLKSGSENPIPKFEIELWKPWFSWTLNPKIRFRLKLLKIYDVPYKIQNSQPDFSQNSHLAVYPKIFFEEFFLQQFKQHSHRFIWCRRHLA